MPIMNRNDAAEVEDHIRRIFDATPEQRATAVRGLFVETLDFEPVNGQANLAVASDNDVLPTVAERIAALDGVHVLYIGLKPSGSHRVRRAEVDVAAKSLSDQLGEDLLLVFANPSGSQLHIIQPEFAGARPTLRRLVVERDLPRRTAVQQIANIFWNYKASGIIRQALSQVFDVEPVTRDFFAAYKKTFDLAETEVTGFAKDEFDARHRFVQILFNRLMFIYFLSRKGWLTFNNDADYLKALLRDYQSKQDQNGFYVSRLKPLFFAGLNNPQSFDLMHDNPAMHALVGDVPFLNGGLFEETELDRRQGVAVPDAAIKRILDDLFDRFNFTIMESTPFDVEVAVDPEMLGKVFEELVTGRHDSGAYYTPRPVVSFMCREALKGYLEGQDTGADADAIARFVDQRDPTDINVPAARNISNALGEVTVVDPACGSGAYLLGMMQELVELQTVLFNVGVDPKSLYQLKMEIIQRNLYGVDIDDFAVNIAMLRLWLSLAIEYEGEKPEPLPNLDFKVVCGDSLLGPNPSAGAEVQGTLGYDADLVRNLGELKAEFGKSSPGFKKNQLRQDIEDLKDNIRSGLEAADVAQDVVDWRVEFAEVFQQRSGFDVVIANPPYVRQELIGTSKTAKDLMVKQYADAVTARSDLYCYFYARAFQVLNPGGMHVFVCSNSWLDVGYGAKLQSFLLDSGRVQAIYESSIERQFATADINTIISVIRRSSSDRNQPTAFVRLDEPFDQALAANGQKRIIWKRAAELWAAGSDGSRFVGDKWGGKYLRAPDIYHHILDAYGDKLVRLGDVATVRFGLKTGANDFFYLTPSRITEFGIEPEYLEPVMTTPMESRRLLVDPSTLPKRLFMCHKDKSELQGTGALAYIKHGESQGYHTRPSTRSRPQWYDLGERATVQLGMNKLVGTTARTFLAAKGVHFTDNFQVMDFTDSPDSANQCASLNSVLFQLFLNTESRSNFGQGVLEIQTYETANLRIVKDRLATVDESVFESEDWEILNPSPLRRTIDNIVFDALGLTSDERDEVYEGVWELVTKRGSKAGSLN